MLFISKIIVLFASTQLVIPFETDMKSLLKLIIGRNVGQKMKNKMPAASV